MLLERFGPRNLTPDVVEVDRTRPVPPNQVLLDDMADEL
jgi:hypothetical protein